MMQPEVRKHIRHNFRVNVIDGGFYGFAMGWASLIAVIPLFVKTLTDSALLIGLISAMHAIGWHVPQLLTSDRVARLRRYKPMVLAMTLIERVPFLGLALVAWFAGELGRELALLLAYALIILQALGAGLTAISWQSMIGKIIPGEWRGTFFGIQAAAASVLSSIGAVCSGLVLQDVVYPLNFVICFLVALVLMLVSFAFLARTREPESEPTGAAASRREFWGKLGAILRRDRNFRWFLLARMLVQFALMASAFFTVYAVERFGMTPQTAGVMTAVFMVVQTVANPLLGWLGDRLGHAVVLKFGVLVATLAALLAWLAPSLGWFYLVFALSGVGAVTFWVTVLSITMEFGSAADRPAYIGLGNTLVGPSTLLAPLLGGLLADTAGYSATFVVAVAGGLLTLLVLQLLMRDPRQLALETDLETDVEQPAVVYDLSVPPER